MKKIVALASAKAVEYEAQTFAARENVQFSCFTGNDPENIIKMAKDAEVFLYSGAQIRKQVLDGLENCKLIIRYGIGYDDIDYEYAAEKGIIFCNAPYYGVIDVAEHALSLILACSKRLVYMNDCVRDKFWNSGLMGASTRLSGKTIGFVGFGKIARHVCGCIKAFGTKAIVYDPYVKTDALEAYGAESVDLDTLLRTADYVTLHLPLNQDTRHMFGKEQFSRMKSSAYLINTSRGGLVNEQELVDALLGGVIAGAGLDVFEEESPKLDERLLHMKNVVLTPHVAWNTAEASFALHKEVTDNVLRYLDGKRPESIINMKE